MYQQHKRSFILMEVLIGVALFSMLVAVMFSIFLRCVKVNETITKQRHLYEKLIVVQARLQNIFSTSVFNNSKETPHYFFIEEINGGQSLALKFENEIELSPDFLVLLGAKIYVDENERLCLASWRHEDPLKELPSKVRKEALLDGISKLEIQLFAPPIIKNTKQKNEELELPRCTWLSSWPREGNVRPALIKLICQRTSQGKEPLIFWFMIPQEIKTIIYRTK